MPVRFMILLSLVVLMAACASSSNSDSAPTASIGTVHLATSNLPTGFYRESRSILPITQVATEQGLGASAYTRRGGQTAVAETFVPRVPTGLGITFVSTQVYPFARPSDARWGFLSLLHMLGHSGTMGTIQEAVHVGATATPLPTILAIIKHPLPPPVSRYRAAAPPQVGEQAAAFVNDSAAYAGEYVYTNRVVLFRRGRYCVVVHVAGNYSQVPTNAAVRLAKVLDTKAQE